MSISGEIHVNVTSKLPNNVQIFCMNSLPFFYRASLDNVFFPSVTLCNINQGRRSFFVSKGLSHDSPLMSTVLSQAYFGSKFNLTSTRMGQIQELFSSKEVVTKGLLGNLPKKKQFFHHTNLLLC